jgi:hypothetical protein
VAIWRHLLYWFKLGDWLEDTGGDEVRKGEGKGENLMISDSLMMRLISLIINALTHTFWWNTSRWHRRVSLAQPISIHQKQKRQSKRNSYSNVCVQGKGGRAGRQ